MSILAGRLRFAFVDSYKNAILLLSRLTQCHWTTCRPLGFSRVQDGFWVRWVSLRNKRDSQARDNQNITDKENPKIPNLVSSKETKPLNYEHIIIQHKTRNGRLRFASSTVLKNAKYDSLKGQKGTIQWTYNIMVLECLLLYNCLQMVHFKR